MKGQLENMMSRARFAEGEFYVQYRDFKELVQLPVHEFWKIAEIVPTHRIARIIERKTTVPIDVPITIDEIIYTSSDSDLLALPVVTRHEVDPETLRFISMRDALALKHPWQRYIELERVKRLKEEGRELLGEYVYIFEKRDGENISMWLEENSSVIPEGHMIHVSSHNMVNADPNIISRLVNTPEYSKAMELLRTELMTFSRHYILFGELVNKGKGPTRVEPTHKYAHWYLFDIYDIDTGHYLPYPLVHQLAYHYRLPCIDAFETWTLWKMEDLDPKIAEWKTWAKRHKREGVVGKVYKDGVLIGFKEKIDLPDLPPEPRAIREKATFPPMPEDRILRALQHAWDNLRDQNNNLSPESLEAIWKDKAIVMPVIAKYLGVEAREHNFNPPRNIFEIYLNTDIAKIREHPNAET